MLLNNVPIGKEFEIRFNRVIDDACLGHTSFTGYRADCDLLRAAEFQALIFGAGFVFVRLKKLLDTLLNNLVDVHFYYPHVVWHLTDTDKGKGKKC